MERFDFDTVIDRKNTSCLKYDFAGEYGVPEDTLPFWIADMDFKVADCITDALRDRVFALGLSILLIATIISIPAAFA